MVFGPSDGMLYYWPKPGEKIDQLQIVAAVTKQWLRLEGDYKTGKLVEYITFRGLTFHYSNWEMDKKLRLQLLPKLD